MYCLCRKLYSSKEENRWKDCITVEKLLSGQLMIATANQSSEGLSSILKTIYYEFSHRDGIVPFPVRLGPIIYYKSSFSSVDRTIANKI